MTYLSDSDLVSPEETLSIYLDTLKTMDSTQMGNYLGLESLLNTSDSAKNSIASALVEQVHKCLDYQITSCDIQSYNAIVTAEVTTFDSASILSDYQNSRDAYLSSVDAVIDGSSKRYEHSLELLLDSINNNTSTITSSVTFHLFNDGVSWKLLENSEALGNAIFGTLSTTPVPDDPDIAGEGKDSGQLTTDSYTASTDSEETDIENTDDDIDASDHADEDNIDEESDEYYYEE